MKHANKVVHLGFVFNYLDNDSVIGSLKQVISI